MVAVELKMVALAAIVLFLTILLAGGARFIAYGMSWAGGPRDSKPGEVSPRAQRCDRAARNMGETFPIFVALAIAVVVADIDDATTAQGSVIYVLARILYVPAYVFHIPFVRSGIWAIALLGIIMTGAPLFGALFT